MPEVAKIMDRLQLDTAPAIKSLQAMQAAVESSNQRLSLLKQAALEAGRSMNLIMDEALKSTTVLYDGHGRELVRIAQDTGKKRIEAVNQALKQEKAATVQTMTDIQNEMKNRSTFKFDLLTGAAAYAGVRVFRNITKDISDVEMGMTIIERVMEDSTADFKRMRDELFALAKSFGQPMSVVQDIAAKWAQAGYGVDAGTHQDHPFGPKHRRVEQCAGYAGTYCGYESVAVDCQTAAGGS